MTAENQVTDAITISVDSDGTSGETLEYATNDLGQFIDNSDEHAYGVEDDAASPSDVGVSAATGSITLN
jgi:hypothetical protein